MDSEEKPDGGTGEIDVVHAATVHPYLPRWRFDGWVEQGAALFGLAVIAFDFISLGYLALAGAVAFVAMAVRRFLRLGFLRIGEDGISLDGPDQRFISYRH